MDWIKVELKQQLYSSPFFLDHMRQKLRMLETQLSDDIGAEVLPEINTTPFRVGTVVGFDHDFMQRTENKAGAISSYEAIETGILHFGDEKTIVSRVEQHVSLTIQMIPSKSKITPAWEVEKDYLEIGDQSYFVEYYSFEEDILNLKLMRVHWMEEQLEKGKGNT